jgi:hypothetical protein
MTSTQDRRNVSYFLGVAMRVAAWANPLFWAINPKIDAKKSPLTAMGVYSLCGALCQMASGLGNQNFYRISESLISIPDALMYLFNGHHLNEPTSIPLNQISDIFSPLNPKANFPILTWPQALQSTDDNIILLTPMQCLDVAQGIRALTKINPLNPQDTQRAINQAYTEFSKPNNDDVLNTEIYPENPKKDFLLFCQAHAPYYQNPALRAVQSLGDPRRNPIGVTQILGCVSEILGIFSGLQTSPSGQTHPLESLNAAISLALKCLIIAGSMKNVADAVQEMQTYRLDYQEISKKQNPVLKSLDSLLVNGNTIYATISLLTDTPTAGVDAMMSVLGPEHDVWKLISFLAYTVASCLHVELDKRSSSPCNER